ncbi:cupin domain-containing protein [Desulfogranum mediterraneum]|uniref:cupin domain-containing protein n=1 Tax=Desulfogranum mediterraneum TaxID=160661 RepID=UPI00041BF4B2|nr:cupin domain-containing protein [Desulfogranum mediterraneum]
MYVKKMTEVAAEAVPVGEGVSRKILISPQEGPNFAMRSFTIAAGGFMPMHTNSVEHEQLILNGRARVSIADQVLEVEKDDVVFIPSGVPHSYTTLGDEPFTFLCLVPNQEDIIEIIE